MSVNRRTNQISDMTGEQMLLFTAQKPEFVQLNLLFNRTLWLRLILMSTHTFLELEMANLFKTVLGKKLT